MHNMQGEKFLLFAFSKVSGSKYCLSFIFTSTILQSFFMLARWCTTLVCLSPRKPGILSYLDFLFVCLFMDAYLIKSINSSFPLEITFWAFPLHYFFYSDFLFSDSLNALTFSDLFSSLCVSFAISFLNMLRHALAHI